MLIKNVKVCVCVILLLVVQACANVPIEPADDGYESRPRYGGDGWGSETQDPSEGWLNRQIFGKKKQSGDSAKKVIEAANNRNASTTLPPSMQTVGSTGVAESDEAAGVSFKDWQQAKQNNTDDYQEFEEFKRWQEYQRAKKSK